MSETPAAKLTQQHIAVLALLEQGTHKSCTVYAMREIWNAAFKDKLEWKHFRSGNRYLYLGLICDTDIDEWKVQYARTNQTPAVPIHFSRSVTSFFGVAIDGDLNQVLRFEPWSAS